uniref:Uncharacterized protein n=1 Tax=Peromyscus maniculatus bairdii TaxID=230844 RepID=A0A8C8UE12_PERMB
MLFCSFFRSIVDKDIYLNIKLTDSVTDPKKHCHMLSEKRYLILGSGVCSLQRPVNKVDMWLLQDASSKKGKKK